MTLHKRWFVPLAASALLLPPTYAFPAPSVQEKALPQHSGKTPLRDTQSDTWAATDALGRSVPDFAQVGPPRPGKFVGIFYFLWLGEHGADGPFDITKILAQAPDAINDPNHALWGPVGAPHHWGESVFGYYRSNDEWVLRKHAQMLSDAGVDTVIFDVTNQLTYPRAYLALCKVWSQVRREGGKTPQIAFLAPFWDPVKVAQTLYQDFYKPGLHPDLWFRWEGKPLILADSALIQPERLRESRQTPGRLNRGETAGQSFVTEKPFTAVGGSFPTYHSQTSAITLSLYRGSKPGGKLVARQRFTNVADNAVTLLELPSPTAAGEYYLEQSEPEGQVGWWSQTGDVYGKGRAFSNEMPDRGDRSLFVRYTGEQQPVELTKAGAGMTAKEAATLAEEIRSFFTFRKPQPDYFTGPTGPGQWGWLDVHPQKPYYETPGGPPEQMTVGVAQNAVDGRLSVLSNPHSHGRSFHNGAQPPPSGQDHTGRNFAEQWERALKVDPEFIFITGWNEWIAGRFTADAPFYQPGPVTFVDSFNHEYSRDIEPVVGGHTDNYYYQMITGIRRFKGVRPDPPPAAPLAAPLRIDGDFRKWQSISAEYWDDSFDTTPRNHPGWSERTGTYRNNTGRNDFDLLKVAHDSRFVYFYARTSGPIREFEKPDVMVLQITTEEAGQTITYAVHRSGGKAGEEVTLEKRVGQGEWQALGSVPCRTRGNEMEMSVPRSSLGQADGPLRFTFKWLDNVDADEDRLNLYRNGDTAPNGRFRYRYEESPAP